MIFQCQPGKPGFPRVGRMLGQQPLTSCTCLGKQHIGLLERYASLDIRNVGVLVVAFVYQELFRIHPAVAIILSRLRLR
jgi:hypothetical protein